MNSSARAESGWYESKRFAYVSGECLTVRCVTWVQTVTVCITIIIAGTAELSHTTVNLWVTDVSIVARAVCCACTLGLTAAGNTQPLSATVGVFMTIIPLETESLVANLFAGTFVVEFAAVCVARSCLVAGSSGTETFVTTDGASANSLNTPLLCSTLIVGDAFILNAES